MSAMRAAKGDRDVATAALDASRSTLERSLTTLALRPLLRHEGLVGAGGRPATEPGCPECERITEEILAGG